MLDFKFGRVGIESTGEHTVNLSHGAIYWLQEIAFMFVE
jgi:hypothetical protein